MDDVYQEPTKCIYVRRTYKMHLYRINLFQLNYPLHVSNSFIIRRIFLYKQHTWSVRKVSDRIFLCEHLMDYNLARLHEPTLNLSAHA
jgi:hypothetical protein